MDFAEHVGRFNAAVTSGHWEPYLDRFSDDAVMEFVGPPVGPFMGKAAIALAYATNPPDDTIEFDGSVSAEDDEFIVPYRWTTSDSRGTMRFTLRAGLIVRLVVTFE